MTLLSICIPAFGACADLRSALHSMLQSQETGFEIVVADFRDTARARSDPAVGDAVDRRLRVVAPGTPPDEPDQCWNQMVAQARGDWITIIGEADYADPGICDVIRATLKRVPDADAFSWGQVRFTPPGLREGVEIARVATGSRLLLPDQADMMRQLFYWADAPDQPDCHFGAWHGAVRRDLLDRISAAFSGHHFEQTAPDVDNRCKVVMLAKRMAMWERPLSVHCALPARAAQATNARRMIDDFPFTGEEGPAARLALAIEGFKRRYGIELEDWESGFIRACIGDCETAGSGKTFHGRKDAYAKAISAWRGKRALRTFKPEFKRKAGLPRFRGVRQDVLHFDMGMDRCADAAEFYRLINAMSFPVDLLDEKLA